MKKMTVLVTGASGFIGSHLLPFLLKNNFQVIALTRQKNKASHHSDLTWVNHFDEITSNEISRDGATSRNNVSKHTCMDI